MAALIDATSYQVSAGVTLTGAELAACSAWCLAVSDGVKRLVHPFLLEPVTVTDKICDAPVRGALFLPVFPIRSITSLYLNWSANGDPAEFTSDHLLTQYTDYYLELDPIDNYNRFGKVLRRGSDSWGYERVALVDRLAATVGPARGAIKFTVAAGTASIPTDVAAACAHAVSQCMLQKVTGMPVTSASLNGGSYSLLAPTVQGVLNKMVADGWLSKYLSIGTARA